MLMRTAGVPDARTFFEFFTEQLVLCCIGALVGGAIYSWQPIERIVVFVGLYSAGLAISLIVFAVVNFFPEFLIRLFDSEPEVIETGARYLKLISFDYLFASIMFCMNGLAIAAGKTYIALINAIANGILVRVPVAYVLVKMFDMGFDGIALAMGFASVGGIIIGAVFVKSGKWKNRVVGIE